MISKCFTSKRKPINESVHASKNKVGKPEPKISKKRTSLIEFSKEETPHRIFPWDIKILGWCPAASVLPHGQKVPL